MENTKVQRVVLFDEKTLKDENERLKQALVDIMRYQEDIAGALHKKTAVWNMAYKALNNHKT